MASFRYRYGDRPLDGYTIEHGVGRGGFGEVYYAVSDSGRQVALKVVQNYEEIELRGIGHCMNLKSPHLVTIFDVKFNGEGLPFVIMEYVAGPSLRQLLDANPQGMGADKAAFFVREIAKGLQYLHDSGVVHRDLKPHNVFYEDGMVKIGDYSLSKAITTSHRSGHTITVGTVHYMAPEISMGKYGPEVDIYALGVMLYEMLTGAPPFVGQTMAEVLMKHMTAAPDVSHLPAPFNRVVLKAMAKDPTERYRTASELVGALFGDRQVEESVTSLSPQTLSVVAARALKHSPVVEGGGSADTQDLRQATPAATPVDRPQWAHVAPQARRHAQPGGMPGVKPGLKRVMDPVVEASLADEPAGWGQAGDPSWPYVLGRNVGRMGAALGLGFDRRSDRQGESGDSLRHEQRIQLALATVTGVSLLTVLAVGTGGFFDAFRVWLLAFTGITVGTCAVDWTRRNLAPTLTQDNGWTRRLIYVPMALGGVVLSMIIVDTLTSVFFDDRLVTRKLMFACLLPFLVMDWRQLSGPARKQRLRLLPALGGAMLALPFANDHMQSPGMAMGLVAGVILATQMISPWLGVASVQSPAAADGANRRRQSKADNRAQSSGVDEPFVHASLAHAREQLRGVTPADSRPGGVSPRSRTVALLLTVVGPLFGLAGLQRLYAGRIGTGILWLLTWGVLGIGQLIDLFVVAAGEMRDGQGRLLLRWKSAVEEPVNALSKVRTRSTSYPGSWADHLIGLLGVALLGIAFALGAVSALRLPEGLRVTMEARNVAELSAIHQFFGPEWPRLAQNLSKFTAVLVGGLGTGLLLIGRRHANGGHMMRAAVAAGLVAISCVLMEEGWRSFDWRTIAGAIQARQFPTSAVESFFNNQTGGPLMVSAFALFGSLFLLAWPRRRMGIEPAGPQHIPTANEADRVEI